MNFVGMTLGSSQNGRGRPQNGITAGCSLELDHFHLCEKVVTNGEPFKNENFRIFGDFFRNFMALLSLAMSICVPLFVHVDLPMSLGKLPFNLLILNHYLPKQEIPSKL